MLQSWPMGLLQMARAKMSQRRMDWRAPPSKSAWLLLASPRWGAGCQSGIWVHDGP